MVKDGQKQEDGKKKKTMASEKNPECTRDCGGKKDKKWQPAGIMLGRDRCIFGGKKCKDCGFHKCGGKTAMGHPTKTSITFLAGEFPGRP